MIFFYNRVEQLNQYKIKCNEIVRETHLCLSQVLKKLDRIKCRDKNYFNVMVINGVMQVVDFNEKQRFELKK